MKTNPITIDMRKLTNEQLWEIARIVDVSSEVAVRGFNGVSSLLAHPTKYGKYMTLREYLATFEQSSDTRNEDFIC